jgi:putative hemolysin
MLLEVALILLLILGNGILAMAEIAMVSARKSRLRQLAAAGNVRALAALNLAESPSRFLSTVQIGITLVGILAGAFGGARLGLHLEGVLRQVPFLAAYAGPLSLTLVVVVITYLSLVLGELVPKRFGLSAPERVAMLAAGPMSFLARIAAPMVSFLSFSTDLLLGLLGFRQQKQASITEDEIKGLMQEGLRGGSFNKVESLIVDRALELDRISVQDLMTPRPKIIWLNVSDSHETLWHKIVASRHARFPVYERNRDNVIGMVSLKSIYAHLAAGIPIKIRDLLVPPLIVPSSQNAVQLLETFKQTAQHVALVTDEYGVIEGIVTLHDVMEAIVGDIPSRDERLKPAIRKRDDGTFLVDGMVEIEEVEQTIPGFRLSDHERGDYRTLAGYVVKQFGRVPREGETWEAQGYVFEIIDMDGHRVDKVLVLPAAKQPSADGKPPDRAVTNGTVTNT